MNQKFDYNSLPPEFLCSICKKLVREPVTCAECLAPNFCLKCAEDFRQRKPNCPVCKALWCDKSLKTNPFFLKIYEMSQIRCQNNECLWEGFLKDFFTHQDECIQKTIECVNKRFGCGWTGTSNFHFEHHKNTCSLNQFRPFFEQIEENIKSLSEDKEKDKIIMQEHSKTIVQLKVVNEEISKTMLQLKSNDEGHTKNIIYLKQNNEELKQTIIQLQINDDEHLNTINQLQMNNEEKNIIINQLKLNNEEQRKKMASFQEQMSSIANLGQIADEQSKTITNLKQIFEEQTKTISTLKLVIQGKNSCVSPIKQPKAPLIQGIMRNISLKGLLEKGFKLGFCEIYSYKNSYEEFLEKFSDKKYVILAGKEKNEDNLLLAAMGEPREVFKETLNERECHFHNGVYWYCMKGKAVGFSFHPRVYLYNADWIEGEEHRDFEDERLSWHLTGNGGWRLGKAVKLSESNQFEKVLLYWE